MAHEITFKIDVYTPATLPQRRLGEYLIELSKLYGESDSVHFRAVRRGSAKLVSVIDEPAVPKVNKRLAEIDIGVAPKEAIETFARLDSMLAYDNATAVVRGLDHGKVIRFPGRTRPPLVEYGLIAESGILEGELIRIGGKDKSVHLHLQNGAIVHTDIETDRDMARRLAPLIFGPLIRLHGTGYWRRSGGIWERSRFAVNGFEQVDDRTLADALDSIRAIDGSYWHEVEDPVAALLEERLVQ